MKITLLAVLVAVAAGPAAIAPAEAMSPAIKGDSGNTYWRDDYRRHHYWRDNGRHHDWRRQRTNHDMRLRERSDVRECQDTTHRYWHNGRRVVERVSDCD
jgi:hypothetical protein